MRAKYIVGDNEPYGEQDFNSEIEIESLLPIAPERMALAFHPKISKYECASISIVQNITHPRSKNQRYEQSPLNYLNITSKKELIMLRDNLNKLISQVNNDLTLKDK